MKLAIATFAILAGICAAAPFHGYLVTGQWDGRTFPNVEWALDITRQVTEWRPHQELKYQNLIPTTAGPALKPTYTAYDAKSRTYFLTTQRNDTAASLWGIVISADTNTSKPVGNEVRFRYPAEHDSLNGLEVWNNNGQLTVLAIFGNCTILKVDYTTGKTSLFGTACDNTRQTTSAMELNPAKNELFIITQSFSASDPARQLVTIDLTTAKYTAVPLADLKNHDANQEYPFELGYFPTLDAVLVFYTGKFDQMIFVERSGKTTFGIFDLAEYDGPEGFYAFTADDYLEDDDFWSDIARDPTTGEVYFQCTTIDQVTGEPSISMCMMPTPKTIGTIQYINVAIWPLTYGYAGLQWVDIVS